MILETFKKYQELTRKDVMKMTGLGKTCTAKWLTILKREHLIASVGKNPHVKWVYKDEC